MSSLSLASLYQDRGIYRVSQIVFMRASDLITKFAFVTTPQREKKCAIIFNHMNVTPEGGGGYCHIWAILVCAAVKGMVFKQFTLG